MPAGASHAALECKGRWTFDSPRRRIEGTGIALFETILARPRLVLPQPSKSGSIVWRVTST
jgi:hypothetical protein